MPENVYAHFIGVGGAGMSGIALVLHERGVAVTGSDLKAGDTTRRLDSLGARTWAGHRAENIAGADTVVYSSAIKEDNPELAAAQTAGIRVIKRAQALADRTDQVVETPQAHPHSLRRKSSCNGRR